MKDKYDRYEAMLPQVSMTDSIPKQIHQTLRSKGDIDPDIRENITYLKELNPGWTHRLYGDEDVEHFIQTRYGEVLVGYYRRISDGYGAARADFFRYLLLYAEGGVYLDLKSSLERPLDEVLLPTDRYILAHWDNEPGGRWLPSAGRFPELRRMLSRGEWQQWHIMAVPGHPFLRAVIKRILYNIDHYHPWRFGVGRFGVLRTTGPLPYTLAIEEARRRVSPELYRTVDHAEELGLEYSIFLRVGSTKTHQSVIGSYYWRLSPIVELGHGAVVRGIVWLGSFALHLIDFFCAKYGINLRRPLAPLPEVDNN